MIDHKRLRDDLYNCLLSLATEEGLNASSKDEVFGCIFGRDSAITILKILKAHHKEPVFDLLEICKRTLLTLVSLQGKEFNLESGEQPGKFIHEFRKDKFERLIKRQNPWFVYADGKLRNYDSIDSTPLILIALYKYYQTTHDNEFLLKILPAVEAGLNWIITFADSDKDLLIEYEFPKTRKHGGLKVQSWTDSVESLTFWDGKFPIYPIAPVEAQSFAWLALKVWSDYYRPTSSVFSQKLSSQADLIKKRFQESFIITDNNLSFTAQALDGKKNQITTITANPLLCLWASYSNKGKHESIIPDEIVKDLIKRAFMPDMFEEDAGIRTMSSLSLTFNPNENSYHNGSFWPMLNGLIMEGLTNFGYEEEALRLKNATLVPFMYFGTPIELYIKKDNTFVPYSSAHGQKSCRYQAWSAAALFESLT